MNHQKPISTFLGIAAAVVLATNSHAQSVYVLPCGDDANTGLTPVCFDPNGPKRTIQAGINAANPGDVVRVASGEYFENINFNGKAITVQSFNPKLPDVVMAVIINGGGSGSVVTCNSGEGADTILSGFVITGGNAVYGGGMLNSLSSPTVTNCSFSGNTSVLDGGGMSNIITSSPTVTNCTFSGNTAIVSGGGMSNSGGSPTVTNCTFSGNMASGEGGGMYNFDTSPTVTNCTFSLNTANLGGGGMNDQISSSPTVTNCTFSGNTASSGGGMSNQNTSNPTVTNTGFCFNTPDQIVGSYTDNGGISLLHCGSPPDPCPADLDNNNVVGILDLLTLLANWGRCL